MVKFVRAMSVSDCCVSFHGEAPPYFPFSFVLHKGFVSRPPLSSDTVHSWI